MKDKIIRLKAELEYYIIDQIILDGNIYLFGVQVQNDEEILTKNYIVLQVKYNGNKIFVDNINDNKLEEINNMFVSRLSKASE